MAIRGSSRLLLNPRRHPGDLVATHRLQDRDRRRADVPLGARRGRLAKDGGIPWEIPADAARYRGLIRNHIAIFGRKTLDNSYTETENMVITGLLDYRSPVPAHMVHSVDEAFAKADEILRAARDGILIKDEVFIIGGGEIFRQTIDRADRLYLTVVHEQIAGDRFFPTIPTSRKRYPAGTEWTTGTISPFWTERERRDISQICETIFEIRGQFSRPVCPAPP
jgi:dihydrofolate reductase